MAKRHGTEHIQEVTPEQALYTLLKDKVGAVDPQDVFYAKRIDKGTNAGKYSCLVGGKRISANQAANLKQEVMLLDKMLIWKLFKETLAHEAHLTMFKNAKTEQDLFWGKAILHSISIMETIMRAVANAEIDKPPPSPLSTPTPRSG